MRDSAVLGGLVQREAIPPVVARIFFGRQHLTFDKGGKGVGDLLDFVKSAKRLFKGKGDGDF